MVLAKSNTGWMGAAGTEIRYLNSKLMEESTMNKKFKSILMMALSLVLVVVMLAGCKPKDPDNPDNPDVKPAE